MDLPAYRLSISDNGRGIPAEKLQSLVATARGELEICLARCLVRDATTLS